MTIDQRRVVELLQADELHPDGTEDVADWIEACTVHVREAVRAILGMQFTMPDQGWEDMQEGLDDNRAEIARNTGKAFRALLEDYFFPENNA